MMQLPESIDYRHTIFVIIKNYRDVDKMEQKQHRLQTETVEDTCRVIRPSGNVK